MQQYPVQPESRHRTGRIITLILILTLVITFIDLWQERPRAHLVPTDDAVYRYAGGIHIHSRYSDGSGTVEEIADAARRTGLDFVVLSDHSTLQPYLDGKQRYYDRILMLVGEEVNTSAGHLLALGVGLHVEQEGPQGLQLLIDTIHAVGGLAILAHPDGRRPWTDWSVDHIHGLEILNADSEWRNDNPWEWLRALLWYAFLPDAALNSLIDRPEKILHQWQMLSRRSRVVAVGSLDAHACIPLWGDQFIRFPSYERMFGFIRTYVITDRPLTGDAGDDGKTILNALRAGRCYVAVDGYERAVQFSFTYLDDEGGAGMGDRVVYRPGSRIRVSAGSSGRVLIRLFRDGVPVAEASEKDLTYSITMPGVYRAEVYQLRRRLPLFMETARPWIFSNPIRVVGSQ